MKESAKRDMGQPILLYQPSVDGGISEYVDAQASELARRGYRVVLLAPRRFLAAHPGRRYAGLGVLLAVPAAIRSRLVRRALFALCAIVNPYILALHVARLRPRLVLLDAMNEAFAPFWAWPHRLLARSGRTSYAATLHDPVRVRMFGPSWWHRLSLRAAYAPLSLGLVHDMAAAASAGVPAHVGMVEVPHGVFASSDDDDAIDVRGALGIPVDAPVALSFGYIADRKNIGLAIEALARVPELHLVVAGRLASSRDRPIADYRALALALGVAGRCHIVDRFIASGEVGSFFRAADFLLMAYSGSFVSQSGVLHVAANWDLPVLASGGEGPLLAAVRAHGLGEVIAPDSIEALVTGLETMLTARREGETDMRALAWRDFRESASWTRNIDLLLAALGLPARVEGS